MSQYEDDYDIYAEGEAECREHIEEESKKQETEQEKVKRTGRY